MAANPETADTSGYSDAHIATMPLHSLTETLGGAGLERRFELEIADFTAEEQSQLNSAFEWAMRFHAEDKRYREPATNHILRVAIRIMHHYGVTDVNLITAALLHDLVEDHAHGELQTDFGTPEEALAAITEEFNPDVAGLVSSVTNPERDETRDKVEQYQEHVAKALAEGDPRVRVLKVSDFTDNALGVIYMPTEGATYRAHRYEVLVPIFEEAIMRSDTPLSNDAKAHIIRQLDETRYRLSVFLE